MTEVNILYLLSATIAKGKGVSEPVSMQVVNDEISRWTVLENII